MIFRENGSLLMNLGKEPLQDIVRFLCYHEKKKGDTYTKHSSIMKRMRLRISEVQPVWTKYFRPIKEDEESDEEDGESEEEEE